MCARVTCSNCGKPGFVGCGRHLEEVLGDVPVVKRCHCDDSTEKAEKATDTVRAVTSWVRSLFWSRGGEVP